MLNDLIIGLDGCGTFTLVVVSLFLLAVAVAAIHDYWLWRK